MKRIAALSLSLTMLPVLAGCDYNETVIRYESTAPKESVEDQTVHAAPEEDVRHDTAPKLLTRVDYVDADGSRNQYNLEYNADGALTRFAADYYSSYGTRHTEYTLSYNGNGQLTRYQNGDNSYPDREYYYASDGTLTGCRYWEDENWQVETVYEYNEQGRLIRESSEDGNDTTDYTYNKEGQLISSSNHIVFGDMEGQSMTAYAYDSQGRLTEKVIASDWGYEPMTETHRYSYEYPPFVLGASSYEQGSFELTELRLAGVEPEHLAVFHVDDSAAFEMKDGYLVGVSGDDYSYTFFYDGESDASFADGLPAVEYEDEITGTYIADYEDIRITITAESDSEYYLTYMASGITLENIPLAYFSSNTAEEKWLMFYLDEYYPEYVGYVEFCWSGDSRFPYSMNAMIDRLEDTNGEYTSLTKTGVFVPVG